MTDSIQGASPLLLEWWKPIKGWEALYSISNTGKIFSHRKNLCRRVFDNGDGYNIVSLYRDGFQWTPKVHHLVADAFLGDRPTSLVVNHIDGNRRNNRISNLEYISFAKNIRSGKRVKLKESDITRIRLAQRGTLGTIAKELGVKVCTLYAVRTEKNWGSVV